uniref:Jacalin-type lectin domain-containing protein n=1 Tax=Equus caballus TaxID=9796 RepID=A0A3Q2GVZ5_HORSE
MSPCGLFSLPACFFHHLENYELGEDLYFSSTPDYENDITGIRVSIGDSDVIKSIQLRYGSSWRGSHGVRGGKTQEFLLRPREHIIGVFGAQKRYLRHLVIYTNQGRLAEFGQAVGSRFSALPGQTEMVLVGIFGLYNPLGITSIGFLECARGPREATHSFIQSVSQSLTHSAHSCQGLTHTRLSWALRV